MEQEQFIEELFDLGAATRRLARTIADLSISERLTEMADEVVGLARAEDRGQSAPAVDRLPAALSARLSARSAKRPANR
jgi:hypothetical protein